MGFDNIPPGPDDIGGYSSASRNNLYGGQIGVSMHRPLMELLPGLGVKLDLKAAFMANSARNQQDLSDPKASQQFISTSVNRTAFAGMVDAGVRLTYSPWPFLTIHGGYQMVWLTGVATAAHNLGNLGSISTSGTVLFHGPTVGATLTVLARSIHEESRQSVKQICRSAGARGGPAPCGADLISF